MKVVRVVARNIEKLSTQLVECADTVAEAVTEDNGEPHQLVQEDTEILRRDWSSQVRQPQLPYPPYPSPSHSPSLSSHSPSPSPSPRDLQCNGCHGYRCTC